MIQTAARRGDLNRLQLLHNGGVDVTGVVDQVSRVIYLRNYQTGCSIRHYYTYVELTNSIKCLIFYTSLHRARLYAFVYAFVHFHGSLPNIYLVNIFIICIHITAITIQWTGLLD